MDGLTTELQQLIRAVDANTKELEGIRIAILAIASAVRNE